jgi:ribosomal protein S18 acetylase RimI-like enzyme
MPDIDDLGVDVAHHVSSLRDRDGPVATVYASSVESGIQLVEFEGKHAREAAALFVASLNALRENLSVLPGTMTNAATIADKLCDMTGFAALRDGLVVGYLTSWFPIDSFRDTHRVGAYAPEWAHGAVGADRAAISRALYRVASTAWAAAGCDVHALTLLAGDDLSMETWFWSGFGMGTVDAIRPASSLDVPAPVGYSVRRAAETDVPALSQLDVEHHQHYTEPPVFMARRSADDRQAWSTFLAQDGNAAWIAEDADGPFGFVRFAREFGGVDVTASPDGVFIDGAYVRGSHRRRGVATAIVDAALRHYAASGVAYCALDFEAFNPEAAAFWTRYFTPVCYSLIRVPESV